MEFEFVGILPLFSSKVSPVPSSDINEMSSSFVGDSPKPSCGCLGRDTIANAAAKVGPAVVNLSAPQGIFSFVDSFKFMLFISQENY